MSVTVSDARKKSLRYSAVYDGETTTRSIAGLNSSTTGIPDSGPGFYGALDNLLNTLQSFSDGTISNPAIITEETVIWR